MNKKLVVETYFKYRRIFADRVDPINEQFLFPGGGANGREHYIIIPDNISYAALSNFIGKKTKITIEVVD